jgi:ATP-dependent DNA ligase
MALTVDLSTLPMEAERADQLPATEANGAPWQYEPKWDGFRCLAFREGAELHLRSKSGQPFERYFPDLSEVLQRVEAERFVLDGEILIEVDGRLSFEELQLRLHPAASRVQKLAAAHPARFMVFDLLMDEAGNNLVQQPLTERRAALERLAPRLRDPAISLSPATIDLQQAQSWLDHLPVGNDGVVAKRTDMPYRSGKRDAMQKIKPIHSVDCVVGGFRYLERQHLVGSLLLGLYDAEGKLDHVGFTSTIRPDQRAELTSQLEAMIEPPGFSGNAPGGPSRWSNKRTAEWQPVRPSMVVEVAYDHVTGGRFRHGTTLLRFRPDKAPGQCMMSQIEG